GGRGGGALSRAGRAGDAVVEGGLSLAEDHPGVPEGLSGGLRRAGRRAGDGHRHGGRPGDGQRRHRRRPGGDRLAGGADGAADAEEVSGGAPAHPGEGGEARNWDGAVSAPSPAVNAAGERFGGGSDADVDVFADALGRGGALGGGLFGFRVAVVGGGRRRGGGG